MNPAKLAAEKTNGNQEAGDERGARWAQLRRLVLEGTLSEELVNEVTTVLDASVSARQAGEADALEVEMALLRELLGDD